MEVTLNLSNKIVVHLEVAQGSYFRIVHFNIYPIQSFDDFKCVKQISSQNVTTKKYQ